MSNTLMKSNLDNAVRVLAKLHRYAETMLSLVMQLQASIGGSEAKCQEELFGSEVFARFRDFRNEGHHGLPPTNEEWNELSRLIEEAFPRFYQFVTIDHRLTHDQLRLCQLMHLSFPHHVIMRIMDVDSNRVTRLKAQANRRLFGDGHASTLERNIRLHF